jgi:hypothetical protein
MLKERKEEKEKKTTKNEKVFVPFIPLCPCFPRTSKLWSSCTCCATKEKIERQKERQF